MSRINKLDRLRSIIDLLDDQILDLVERRLDVAREVTAAKKQRGAGNVLNLCPERESEIVERLSARRPNCDGAAIRDIWRELIAHSLQAQGRLELVLNHSDDHLHAAIRNVFGSAPRLVRVDNQTKALDLARSSEVVAILPWPVPPVLGGLRLFRIIKDEHGRPIAGAIGRVPEAKHSVARRGPSLGWTPTSWRSHTALQMPAYANREALTLAERRLADAVPVVSASQAGELKRRLGHAAAGEAFLVQAGDCAESFDGFAPEHVLRDRALLLKVGKMLPVDVVHVARAAGQYGKPRSADTEMSENGPIPTYRGDAVNGAGGSRGERDPDPARLLRAHTLSVATAALLDSRASGGSRVYASHEALLLNYEQALTRFDRETGRWWANSGHMVWIGHRTRALDGAHVEFARGIANPIGLKCGADMGPDELIRLIERLDPGNEPGRLTLIGRFGAGEIERCLPRLMQATRSEGRAVLWISDPMHGNSRMIDGWKTRRVEDVLAEIQAFFQVALAQGVYPGGVHLESTSRDVAECVGGPSAIDAGSLGTNYESLCDPRLNADQMLEVAEFVAHCLKRLVTRRARAA